MTTTYVHDGFDNLIQESSPDVGTTTHLYDAAGNRIQSTDARGVVVQNIYDALNRRTSVIYPGSTSENAKFVYDAGTNGKGQLTSMTDPSGTTTWTYDHRGNVLSESRTTADTILAVSYLYNTTNLPGVTAQNVVSAVTYAPFGGTTGWLRGNTLTQTRLLDQDYRLTDLTVSSTTGLVHDLNYGYNTVDQLISQQDTLRAAHFQVFGYDVLDRLQTASGFYGSQSYTLDANGNRLNDNGNRSFTYNHANRR